MTFLPPITSTFHFHSFLPTFPDFSLFFFCLLCQIEPNALHLYSRGTILAECNQLEFAVKDFSKAIILQDDQQQNSEFKMRCIYRRASVFYDMKKYNAAVKDLMTILIQEPQMVHSRVLLGKSLKMVGELEKAEEQILHAIFIEVDQSSHYSELGDIRYQMDEKKKIKMAIKGIQMYLIKCLQYRFYGTFVSHVFFFYSFELLNFYSFVVKFFSSIISPLL